MNYSLELSRRAARYLDRLDPQTHARMVSLLRDIAQEPHGRFSKPMAGFPGDRAARLGPLRVLFTVFDDRRVVRVNSIGPRGQIYRELGR